MAILTPVELGQDGLDVDAALAAAAAAGDRYPNDDRTFFVMDNADASPHTATVAATRSTVSKEGFGVLDVDDIAVAVPASERRFFRAPIASHSDAGGFVNVTYDDVTSVTVAAIRLARG